MAEVFISYRRKSCEDLACLLRDRLQDCGYEVFMDVYCLGRGNYIDALREEIRECTHFIVLLAPDDLERCKNEEDVFRQEIEFAYEFKKNIVPLFKNGFEFPKTLPKSINKLPSENGMKIYIEYLDPLMQKLTEKFLVPQTELDPEQQPIIVKNPPKGKRYGAVDEPITQYTGKPLAEMVDIARSDVTDDMSLFRIIEEAEQNESNAYLRLAEAYLNNTGMPEAPENSEKGIYWVCKAIEHKESHAMYLLGYCYEKGTGVPVNNALAAYWYEQGATQSVPSIHAIYAMADCCYKGIGIEPDLLTEARWYREAMCCEYAENAKKLSDAAYTFRYISFLRNLDKKDRKKLKNAGYSLDDVGESKVSHVQKLYDKTFIKSSIPVCFFALCLLWWIIVLRSFIGRYWEGFSGKPEEEILDLYLAGLILGSLLSGSITIQLNSTNKKIKYFVFFAIILIIELIVFLFSKPVIELALNINPILGIIVNIVLGVFLIWGFTKSTMKL